MTLPVATLASLWVSSTFPRLVGTCGIPLTMAPSPAPLQGVPAGWVPSTGALANQDLVFSPLICLEHGDAGGLWGCPQAAGPC